MLLSLEAKCLFDSTELFFFFVFAFHLLNMLLGALSLVMDGY